MNMGNETRSIFLNVEGDRPMNRLWDFLLIQAEYDHSLKEISVQAGVSYATTKLLFKEYFSHRKLIKGRVVGRAKLFQLDFENPIVEAFRNYYFTVIEENTSVEEKLVLTLPKKSKKISRD